MKHLILKNNPLLVLAANISYRKPDINTSLIDLSQTKLSENNCTSYMLSRLATVSIASKNNRRKSW